MNDAYKTVKFNWRFTIDGNESRQTFGTFKECVDNIKSVYGKIPKNIWISKTVREDYPLKDVHLDNEVIEN